jgi:hypothetical protein
VIVYGHFYKSDKEVVEERQMLMNFEKFCMT